METVSGDVLLTDNDGFIYRIQSSTFLPITHPATAQQLAVGAIVTGNQGQIALNSSGDIFTSNSRGRIVMVDPTGASSVDVVNIPQVACPTGQAGMGGQPGFRGLAFTPDGDLAATGYCLDQVYIFPESALAAAASSGVPISTLPTPFAQNPSGALDTPDFNGPFGLVFWDADANSTTLVACLLPPESDNTIWVDVNGPIGTADGTPAKPHLTIQDAVDNAGPGDVIKVLGGQYVENIDLHTSGIHLIGADHGAAAAVDASSGLSAITIPTSVSNVSIQNFRIESAHSPTSGLVAGILIYGATEPRGIEICNNVFTDNDAGVIPQDTSPLVINNDFVSNEFGMYIASGSQTIIRNNIFQENDTGIHVFSPGNPTSDHNLFWMNTADLTGTAGCTSCVFGMDPLLANPLGNDYHLSFGSPAIDTGSGSMAPALDFDFDARPIGLAIDIGADEIGPAFVGNALFSNDIPDFPNPNWNACTIGLFGGPLSLVPHVHRWKVLSRTATNIEVIISADTVNVSETGEIIARITDDVGTQTVTVPHPAALGGTSMPLPLTVTPGNIYTMDITYNPGAGNARHYRVGAREVDVELGWEPPPLLYAVHGGRAHRLVIPRPGRRGSGSRTRHRFPRRRRAEPGQ